MLQHSGLHSLHHSLSDQSLCVLPWEEVASACHQVEHAVAELDHAKILQNLDHYVYVCGRQFILQTMQPHPSQPSHTSSSLAIPYIFSCTGSRVDGVPGCTRVRSIPTPSAIPMYLPSSLLYSLKI